MTRKKGRNLLLLGVLLVVVDQVIKVLVKTHMTLGESIPVLGDWFQLLFVENKGMAFGMAFGGVIGKYLLTLFRLVLFAVLVWWISKLLKRSEPVPTGVLVGLTLITAGAFGNIVDCLCYGQLFSESTYQAVATFGGSYAPIMQGRWWTCSTSRSGPGRTGFRAWADTSSSSLSSTLPIPASPAAPST